MLITQDKPWPWDPERCPADKQFVEMIHKEGLYNQDILHLGTGGHHYVGKSLSSSNYVLGLTNCPEEIKSYVDLVIENPGYLWRYRVLFTDIHATNLSKLGMFDIVTLFHLGEFPLGEYSYFSIQDLLVQLTFQLHSDGLIIGYTGSSAWDRVGPEMESVLEDFGMSWKCDYESLKVWQLSQ